MLTFVSLVELSVVMYVPGALAALPSFSTDGVAAVTTKCYGCASASVEHCLTLLRALASKPASRHELYQQGLIQQLIEYNLRRGSQVSTI